MRKTETKKNASADPTSPPTKGMKRRLLFVGGAILLLSSYITYTLGGVMIIRGAEYREKAQDLQVNVSVINAPRGDILDTEGKVLATSEKIWSVVISPSAIMGDDEYQKRRVQAEERKYEQAVKNGEDYPRPFEDTVYNQTDEISTHLAEILGMTKEEIAEACSKRNSDGEILYEVVIAKEIGKAQYEAIEQFKEDYAIGYYSVYNRPGSKRVYPQNELASQVIGFVNAEGGAYGVESFYEPYLKGVNGREEHITSRNGEILPGAEAKYNPPKEGNDVYLTINSDLQASLEKHLNDAVQRTAAGNRAVGIIMNAKTGAVLAMATAPGYDLNNYNEMPEWYVQHKEDAGEIKLIQLLKREGRSGGTVSDLSDAGKREYEAYLSEMERLHWVNKAVSEVMYPGSIFKSVTTSSALEAGAISKSTSFNCPGFRIVDGVRINCHKLGGHGTLDLLHGLKESCNPYLMQTGEMMGKQTFSDYFNSFGFTEKTGVDLPGEAVPLVRPAFLGDPLDLANGDFARSTFGQVNSFTPLQMLTAFTAIVNGGYLLTPYVIGKISDSDGNIVMAGGKEVRRQVLSEETSQSMKELLKQVVELNGGNNAKIEGYSIGGKSGTAEKVEYPAMGMDMRYVGTFAAFTPAEDPEIAMLVCVDEPLGNEYYGSKIAAPVVSEVFKECLTPVLGIAREGVEKKTFTISYGDVTNKSVQLARSNVTAKGAGEVTVIGNGETVISSIPPVGSEVPIDGRVVLVTEGSEEPKLREVPDVRGKTLEEANNILAEAGFNLLPDGGAVNNQAARAESQSIPPGRMMPEWTVVKVTFMITEE